MRVLQVMAGAEFGGAEEFFTRLTIALQKTDIEHILDAPDTYIGSIELDSVKNWVMDAEDNMRHTNVSVTNAYLHAEDIKPIDIF